MRRVLLLPVIILSFCFGMANAQTQADTPAPIVASEAFEDEAKKIGYALRCVVCQNQSIEDSDASLAEDMRRLVRKRLMDGDSPDEVIEFMRQRYGDYVLLKPPVQANTYVLWFLPLLLIGGVFLWFLFQRRRIDVVPEPLSTDERLKLQKLSLKE